MMETFPVEDNFDEFLESMTNSYDFLEESTEESVVEESAAVEESFEESTEESSIEENLDSPLESIVDEVPDATYEDVVVLSETDYTPILDSISVTNGLLSALLFCFVAKWCVELIQSGVRRLMKNA